MIILESPRTHYFTFRAHIDFRKSGYYAINLIKCACKYLDRVPTGRVLYRKLDTHILQRARVI